MYLYCKMCSPWWPPSNLWLLSLIKLSVFSRSDGDFGQPKTNRDIGKVQFLCQGLMFCGLEKELVGNVVNLRHSLKR